ncbi:nascent polypeptide-associated complex subunit alpha, muscle-specific form isoform X2 [Oncorhynchus kisutch]|uniref:nascent polypeptide-associated complex subunit alpha, muscle-specific form isoform X2 n=1 Tax=Oncorhynchus kisutch TaxID=8019 RepID=UPI0012DD8576|nr:nascent polypeptide-associated complex subunit alpha, muscle-specific form isoform X2 [Oncorhynchus kisutch]XP_031641762.1 nascent polypeptide-associated complex subunit alpha, muscle-specific form isoform X2 [Oncorhynchus kisutch]
MDQEEDFLDFKSLRAKFQDEEVFLLKQPGTKSALPETPKVLPPPHSPTNCLPSLSSTSHTPSNSHSQPRGARPSLFSSLQGPGGISSRVIVKEEKKAKSKDKDEGKVKLLGKKKAEVKADKEKSDERMNGGKDIVEVAVRSDLLDQKQKKEADLAMKNKKVSLLSPGGSKGGSVKLVDMSPSPINTTKKKGFLGIGKKRKEGRVERLPFPILDIASPDLADPEPLMPLTTFGTPAPPGDIPIRTVIIPPSPAVHIVQLPPASIPAPVLDSPLPLELTHNPVFTLLPPTLKPAPAAEGITVVTPPNPIPVIPDPPIIDHIPETLSPKTPAETIPAPTLPVSVHPTPSPVTAPFSPIPAPPVTHILPAVPSPPTLSTSTPPPPVIATPSPSPPPDPTPSPPPPPTPPAAELESVVVDIAVIVETSASPLPSHPPSPPAGDPSVAPPSLQPERPVGVQERPLSALLALGRAEEMSPPKKRGSEIIFNALEKAKRTLTSPLMTPIPSRPVTPTIEDLTPPPHSPSPTPVKSLPELPPIDYDDQAGAAAPTPLIPALVKGQASPMLEGIAEKGARDLLPDLFVVPPPPPRKRLPEASTRGSPPEKPPQLPSVDLTAYAVEIPVPSADSALNIPEFEDVGLDVLELEAPEFQPADLVELEVSKWGAQAEDSTNESCGNAYEDMPSAKQKVKGQPTKKKKGTAKSKTQAPYNPYAETQLPTEETPKTDLFLKKTASETPDEKQMKKKEKQSFEKEKKEQKERERKEQKEREKKENEMKLFKITGQKEAIYQATVMVASKGHKNNLAVKNGDIVSIIRTTNCPKGKWLARDSTNTYGYISVSDVELDIKEMLEMGKRASRAISCKNITTMVEQGGGEVDSRTSNHYPLQEDTGSFTDDSEEWAHDDDDEPFSSLIEEDPTESSLFPYCLPLRPEEPEEPISPMDIGGPETVYLCKEEADMVVLPPPDLYADIIIISDA